MRVGTHPSDAIPATDTAPVHTETAAVSDTVASPYETRISVSPLSLKALIPAARFGVCQVHTGFRKPNGISFDSKIPAKTGGMR